VLAHRDAVEERRALEDHRDPLADGKELLLSEAGEVVAVEDDSASVGVHQPDEALEEHALPCPRTSDDGECLTTVHLQPQVVEHDLGAEGLVEALEADQRLGGRWRGGGGGHVMVRRSLVRKKSASKTATEATATVWVVARPTPSVPPSTVSPL